MSLDNSVSDSNYICDRMRWVWDFAKCYNFRRRASEGFYTLQEYRDREAIPSDFRDLPQRCDTIKGNAGDIICGMAIHGAPNDPLVIFGWPWGGGAPTVWQTAYLAANPNPGALGGADSTMSYWNLLNPAACGALTPIKTGVIVTRPNGSQYSDAVCSAPGCWYQPGGGVGAAGSCNP